MEANTLQMYWTNINHGDQWKLSSVQCACARVGMWDNVALYVQRTAPTDSPAAEAQLFIVAAHCIVRACVLLSHQISSNKAMATAAASCNWRRQVGKQCWLVRKSQQFHRLSCLQWSVPHTREIYNEKSTSPTKAENARRLSRFDRIPRVYIVRHSCLAAWKWR